MKKRGAVRNRVDAFPVVPTAIRSGVYFVTAGSTPVFVEKFEDVHYAHFAFSGRCEITVSVKPSIGHANLKYINRYSISPRRYGVTPSVELNRLTFTLSQPRKLVIQVNEYERLFIFAETIEKNPPKPGGRGLSTFWILSAKTMGLSSRRAISNPL